MPLLLQIINQKGLLDELMSQSRAGQALQRSLGVLILL